MHEKPQGVLWFNEYHFPVTVQRRFVQKCRRPPPDVKQIKSWYLKLKSGRPRNHEEKFDAVSPALQHNPRKSIRKASLELHVPSSLAHII